MLGATGAGDDTPHHRLGEAQRRAEFAGEVSTALAGSLNVRRTVLRLLDLIRPALADWALIVMPDAKLGRLVLHGGADPRTSRTTARNPAEELGVGRILRSGRTELLHVAVDDDTVDGLDSLIPDDDLRAEATDLRPADVLGVALTARGSHLGVLVLVRGAGRGFPVEDVALAEQVASRAAVALDSARLYEDRSRVASVLQAGLRPPALPSVPGLRLAARFRAAAEHVDIGGDFYDAHGSGDDWLLALGDVCGKGVEAAVLNGRARQSIRTAVHFDRSPAAVLGALNSALYEEDSDRFVTAVCTRVRPGPDGADLTVSVAGHPAPLLLRADGTLRELEVAGIVAGVLPSAAFTEVHARLDPGDTLLMFTDGTYEARGQHGVYGMDRLRALLPVYAGAGPEAVCEAVEQDVVEFLGGRPHDDMALFAVSSAP
ncbi:serine/threonine protein phosphatase [Actinokineospora bangkokensis]|uniref:Serine/threonine protein phosphatase n=1 Tax=Actinokineospora bangkokensis TaxID=1193682 RepID=A0A1Q9LRM0_9PSEU|nr:serine/threonine protein phosphatase [Actinokineospora bangkokensis]